MKSLTNKLAIVVTAALLAGCDNSGSAQRDALESERQQLAAQGKRLTEEMERANRNHDFSQVERIRKENAEFQRKASEHMVKQVKEARSR